MFHPLSFDFKDYDIVMFKDEGFNAVIQIVSIQYQCRKENERTIVCYIVVVAYLCIHLVYDIAIMQSCLNVRHTPPHHRSCVIPPLGTVFLCSPSNVAKCGAPPVDWANVLDAKAPSGWHAQGFFGHVSDLRLCGNGWNAYAFLGDQGQLYATMIGSGRATVQYRDCWSEGFVGLYLNGLKIDQSSTNDGKLRTYRCTKGEPDLE